MIPGAASAGLNRDMDLIDAVFLSRRRWARRSACMLAAGKVWSAMAGYFNLACNVLFLKDATDPPTSLILTPR